MEERAESPLFRFLCELDLFGFVCVESSCFGLD